MLRHAARITILAGAMTVLTVAAPALPAATGPSLTIAGASFAVDGRPRFLLLVSYFDALRASDATLEGDFAFLRRHGLDGVRIFPNWWRCAAVRQCGGHAGDDTLMAAPDGALRPAVLARLKAVLAAAGRHGLIVDLSFARETVRDTAGARAVAVGLRRRRWPRPCARSGRSPHVMIDLQNEVNQNRLFADSAAADAPHVAALARRVDGGSRIVFVSTSEREAERYTYCGVDGCPLDVLAVHDARERNWHDRTPAVVRELVALGARARAATGLPAGAPGVAGRAGAGSGRALPRRGGAGEARRCRGLDLPHAVRVHPPRGPFADVAAGRRRARPARARATAGRCGASRSVSRRRAPLRPGSVHEKAPAPRGSRRCQFDTEVPD